MSLPDSVPIAGEVAASRERLFPALHTRVKRREQDGSWGGSQLVTMALGWNKLSWPKMYTRSCFSQLSSFSLVLLVPHPFAAPSQVPHHLGPPIPSMVQANLVARINGSGQRTVNPRGNAIWKSLISQACVALKVLKKE